MRRALQETRPERWGEGSAPNPALAGDLSPDLPTAANITRKSPNLASPALERLDRALDRVSRQAPSPPPPAIGAVMSFQQRLADLKHANDTLQRAPGERNPQP